MLRENVTKRKLRNGETVFGVFIPIAAPALFEICGLAGFDYVVIDAEHGPIDVAACENLVRAAEITGVTPIARVPSHEPTMILRFLDCGVQGIIIPHVNSRIDAEKAVDAVKYPPLGKRGSGMGRAAGYGLSMTREEVVRLANAETLVIAMLEHQDVLAELSSILSVPGIDGFVIGLGDLSVSMGFPGEISRPEVQDVVERMLSRIIGAGRVLSQEANDPEAARSLIKRGYRMIDCTFANVAAAALRQLVTSMRRGASPG